MSAQVTMLDYPALRLGEAPIWDPRARRYYFVDAAAAQIHSLDPETLDARVWQFESRTSSFALREQGGFIVALATGVYLTDEDGDHLELVADPEAEAEHRSDYNDGKVDPVGRFVFDSANLPQPGLAPQGGLYSLDPSGNLLVLDREITIGNGPCWSLDGRTLYHGDSMRYEIHAYDYDIGSGAASNKRVFADTSDLGGIPDGATVDSDGCIWVAICEGGKIARYSPEGELMRTVEMPVSLVSSVTFGGDDLDALLVTSIDPKTMTTMDLPAEELGGRLFLVTGLGTTGRAEPRFPG